MKVLIFGATGNCGKYIANHFIKKGCVVYGVGRSCKPEGLNEMKFFQGDIQNLDLFSRLPKDIDLVVNLAGVQPSILTTSENTDLTTTLNTYVDVNIKGVFNILEYVRLNNIKSYVFTTTHRDYELYWENGRQLGNDLPPAINYQGDHTMYAISKTSAKMMGDYYSQAFDVRVFNLRLPMIFLVPDCDTYLQDGKPVMMPFLKIIKHAMLGEDLEVWGDPNLNRDYVHIDNLVSLIDLCHKSELKSGTFNVGTGEGVTTEDFVRSISRVFSPSPDTTKFKYKPEKRTYKCAVYDVSDTQAKLGYSPILLEDMLNRLKKEMEVKGSTSKWGWNL